MKMFTLRLGQFSIGALLATVLFRYMLNLCIGMKSWTVSILCSVIYFCCMFLCGRYFGKKDATDNGIHDIGFRFHAVTYILCIGTGYAASHIGWNTESLRSMTITAISWGGVLLAHFILFLIEQKRTIKGYAKEEIFD